MYVPQEQANGVHLRVPSAEMDDFIKFAEINGLTRPSVCPLDIAVIGKSKPSNYSVVFRDQLTKVQAVVDAWLKCNNDTGSGR